MMKTIAVELSGPDVIVDILAEALRGEPRTLVCPVSMHPGYVVELALVASTPATTTEEE